MTREEALEARLRPARQKEELRRRVMEATEADQDLEVRLAQVEQLIELNNNLEILISVAQDISRDIQR